MHLFSLPSSQDGAEVEAVTAKLTLDKDKCRLFPGLMRHESLSEEDCMFMSPSIVNSPV